MAKLIRYLAYSLLTYCLMSQVSALEMGGTLPIATQKMNPKLTPKPVVLPCESISSWNHIISQSSRYQNLKDSPEKYHFYQDIKGCAAGNNMSGMLVKNVIDWHQQHSTGIEIDLLPYALNFSSLSSFSFELTINTLDSERITKKRLMKHLSRFNDKDSTHALGSKVEKTAVVNSLVDSFIHINIVFYGLHHDDVSKKTLYGSYPIALPMDVVNQQRYIDIAIEDLQFYIEQNYADEHAEFEQAKDQPIIGVLVMAESANHRVVKNYTPSTPFNESDMLFNELSVLLKDISITTH